MLYPKTTGRAMSIPGGLIVGGSVSLGITVLMSAIFAWMLSTERVQWEQIGYWIMGMLLLGSFAGAMIACSRVKRQRLLVSVLSGIVYLGILLSITALFFGGQYDGVIVTAILVLGGSTAAGLLGLREGSHSAKAGKRHRARV